MATATLVLNGLILVGYPLIHGEKIQSLGTFGMIVLSIGVADFLCGIYLAMLSVANMYDAGNFVLVETVWRKSVKYTIIFSVALWFSLLSPGLLLFLSANRATTILVPFHRKMKSTQFNMSCILLCYTSTFVLVSLILLWKMYWSIVPTSNLCSPFVDPLEEVKLIKALTFLVVSIQLAALMLIIIANFLLTRHIFRSGVKMKKYSCQKKSKISTYLQIYMLTGTNILCWIPVNMIYLFSMFLQQFSLRLLIWATVAMVPINSIVNPTIFLIKTIPVMASKMKRKM